MQIVVEEEIKGQIDFIRKTFKNELSEAVISRSVAQAINGVLQRSIPKVNKGVKGDYNITQKYLKRIAKVQPKAKASLLYGGLAISRQPIPMIAFTPKQTTTGVSIAIRKGKPTAVKSAFIATMASGHQGVYARGRYEKGRGFVPENARSNKGKIRITQLHTASPFTMGLTKSVSQQVQTFMATELPNRVEGILISKLNKLNAK